MMRLPEKYKDTLNFKYLLELTDAEIAEIFGIKKDGVISMNMSYGDSDIVYQNDKGEQFHSTQPQEQPLLR